MRPFPSQPTQPYPPASGLSEIFWEAIGDERTQNSPESDKLGTSISLITHPLFRRSSLPEQPANGREELDPSSHPQGRLHATTAATQPSTHNGANQQEYDTADSAIPLHIGRRLIGDLRIGRDIEVDAGQDHGRDLVVAQRSTAGHRAGGLECQEADRDQLEEEGASIERLVGRGVRDEIGLDQGHSDDNEDGLDHEGDEEGAAAQGAHAPHDGGEDHGAGEEAGDRAEGFEPAPWFAGGLVRGAEAEENGVSCERRVVSISCCVRAERMAKTGLSHTGLHAQEAGPGIVCAAIAETRQEA